MIKPISTPVQRLKTPVNHFTGQIKPADDILELIPPHTTFAEAFGGGAALLFAKQPAKINVVNDTNGEIINFYRTVVSDFEALEAEIHQTIHSREQFEVARFIYQHTAYFDRVKRAWAVWALSQYTFMNMLDGSFALSRTTKNTTAQRISLARGNFTLAHKELLERCTVEHENPVDVIRRYDSPGTFHYLAPGLDGPLDQEGMEQMLKVLTMSSGRFMLVTAADEVVDKFAKINDWHIWELDRPAPGHIRPSKKQKLIITNYTAADCK